MRQKLIITNKDKKIYIALINNNNKLLELNVSNENEDELVGRIYIGKVMNVLKGMNAAFINIGEEKNAYLSLKNGLVLKQGEEIIVQVIKEPSGAKGIVVTQNISLTGKYVVLTQNKNYIGLSGKITDSEERDRLNAIVQNYVSASFGFIIRTNAQGVKKNILTQEIEYLIKEYDEILHASTFRTCYQQLCKSLSPVIKVVRDMYDVNIESYITDNVNIYEEMLTYIRKTNLENENKIKLYDDESLSLFNLYSLESKIKKALNERVWLKSGGCIVIQPTEALVSIDVNTAKYTGKKNFQETIFKINLEAAKEIADQLRLRNLSGIIIIDFIDMKDKENIKSLIDKFSVYLKEDRNKVFLLGMTKLGLIELTRRKTNKPLHEQINASSKCISSK